MSFVVVRLLHSFFHEKIQIQIQEQLNNNTRQRRVVLKILLYAPSNDEGLEIMKCILDEIQLKYRCPVEQITEGEGGGNVDQQQQQEEEEDDNTTDDDDDDDEYQNNRWLLLPMLSTNQNLRSTNLGDILQDALIRARRHLQQAKISKKYGSNGNNAGGSTSGNGNGNSGNGGSVVFLGMDSPDSLPLQDIIAGLGILPPQQQRQQQHSNTIMNPSQSRPISSLNLSSHRPAVILCPADDGGYGMLCIPSQLDATLIFKDVLWSHPLTAISQLKAITDSLSFSSTTTSTSSSNNKNSGTTTTTDTDITRTTTTTSTTTPIVSIVIGQLMYDIDEPQDLKSLCQRLQQQLQLRQQQEANDGDDDDDVGGGGRIVLPSTPFVRYGEVRHDSWIHKPNNS